MKHFTNDSGQTETTVYIDGVFELTYTSSGEEQNVFHIMDDKSRIAMVRIGDNLGDSLGEDGDDQFAIKYILEDHLGSSVCELARHGAFLEKEEYYPFGETSFASYGKKRYKYCGKERDTESGLYYYGARYYNAWTCRFFGVDPLKYKYHYYTPYQYAGNKPINFIDLEGKEPFSPSFIFLPHVINEFEKFFDTKPGKFVKGAFNVTTGSVGVLLSITYICESGGVGAALGGTLALQMSLGEIGIGVSQMVDSFSSKPKEFLHSSGSIPGLVGYGTNSKYAPFLDALGHFSPTMFTSGKNALFSMKSLLSSYLGVKTAYNELESVQNIKNGIALIDQINDTKGVVVESFNMISSISDSGSFNLTFKYILSYTIQAGDTLSQLAEKFHTSVELILKENNIKDPNKINAVQKIKISAVEFQGGDFGGAGATTSY